MTLLEVDTPRWIALGGSVAGTDHRRALRNSQDGLALSGEGAWRAAVVTDGCSSGRASEVGARLGAAFLAETTARAAPGAASAEALAADVTRALVDWLRALAATFPEERREDVVAEMLLFSFLAAVIGPGRAIVFGIGDGLFASNGAVTALSAGPDNAPPYAGYGVLGEALAPSVHLDMPSEGVRSLVIATDGALDLLARASEPLADGLPQGGLEQFETEARYIKNPSLVQKRLVVIGERNGRLRDDTTIAVLLRAPGPSWT